MKRLLDFTISFVFLLLFAPFILMALLAVWLEDFYSPFFWSKRVGYKGHPFWMLKIRSMTWNADQSQSITPTQDKRITSVGRILRSFKIDELLQLWNVLRGDMSLVGPRPDVDRGGVALYSSEERAILEVKPGMVDFASLVFSEEGKILERFSDLETGYYAHVFPLKKKLMLFYVKNRSLCLDFKILCATSCLFFSKKWALRYVLWLLKKYQAPSSLIQECYGVSHI